jgi:glycosyltransferase involved in cell wall biosynthesis
LRGPCLVLIGNKTYSVGTLMKIGLLVNDLTGGGAEKAVILYARYLSADAGHDVTIYTLESADQAYELPPSVPRRTLVSGRLNRGVGRIASLPIQAAELTARFRKDQIDVGLNFLQRANAVNALSRRFGNRAKIVLSEQNFAQDVYPRDRLSGQVMRAIIRTTYPLADRVLAASLDVKVGLEELGLPPDLIEVAHNPVEVPPGRGQQPRTLGTRPAIITTVGRLVDLKDHPTLIRAFARVRESHEATLQIVGAGPNKDRLAALAGELEVSEDVLLLGWHDDPYSVLQESDIFVLSSTTEGFGIVLVEALACGLPAVSTDCKGGPREILEDGSSGLLVPVGDPEPMAAAILRLIEDEGLYAAMSSRATKRAGDFDLPQTGGRILQILSSL